MCANPRVATRTATRTARAKACALAVRLMPASVLSNRHPGSSGSTARSTRLCWPALATNTRTGVGSAQSLGAGFGNGVVVVHGASADSDGAHHMTAFIAEWNSAGEGNESTVGHFDIEQRAAGLG
jgi:hypothetical protein